MEISNKEQKRQLQDDEISLKDLVFKLREWFDFLFSKWAILLTVGLIGAATGLFYASFQKPLYTAECTFVLEESDAGSGFGQYAGFASVVGIDMGAGGNNGIFQGENIFALYRSRLMIEKTLLTEAWFNGKRGLLIDRYIESNNLRKAWKKKPDIKNIQFTIPKKKFTLSHDSIIGVVVDEIKNNYLTVEKPDKKLAIVSVKVKGKDEFFAKAFTEKIVANVNDFYIQTKTKRSFDNVKLLQKQVDSIRLVLNTSIGGTATAVDAYPNANAALQILRVPSQRRQIDVQANSAIYTEVVKNLEISKMSLRQETPLIKVIDEPVLPLKKQKLGNTKGALLGGLYGISLAALCLFVLKAVSLKKYNF